VTLGELGFCAAVIAVFGVYGIYSILSSFTRTVIDNEIAAREKKRAKNFKD